jgi:hypothetical protein
MTPFWIKWSWWLICNLWQEFTWAILVGSFAHYFPRIYGAAASLVSIQRRKALKSPHHKIGLSPGPDGSVLCAGQHGDQAGFNF